MNGPIRLVLIIGALFTLFYMLYQIRKNRMEIVHSLFWASFSGFLLLLSLFPEIVMWASEILGIQSPINVVFILIIFILIIKMFSLTMRICHLEQQLQRMAQHIALHEAKDSKKFTALQNGEDINNAEYTEKE